MKKNNIIKVLVGLGLCLIFIFGLKSSKEAIILKQNLKFQGFIKKIEAKYPDLKKEDLIDILNSENASYDLSKFGIYKADSIIDYSSEYRKDILKLSIFIILCISTLLFFHYIDNKSRKKYIELLVEDLTKISKADYSIKNINEEGDLAKLQAYIYKLATVLKQEAQISQLQKNTFKNNLEDISHQIKTPLSSINLLLDNLEDEDLDPSIKNEIIKDIKNETSAITNLVLMLLKISTLEAKARPFFRKNITVKDLVNHAINVLKPEIKEKNIQFILNYKDESFFGDFNWEKEVFINLIKNAIEHGSDNIIKIQAKNTNSFLQVNIINKGVNFDIHNKNRLFDRFYKSSDNEKNFGIGLNLTKLIVEEDNGKINLKVKDGYTIFTIRYFIRSTL